MSRPRLCREETCQQIILAADKLFRQYGFGKTTVADIAKELGMSSANIYKFFSSRNALVEGCANRNLLLLKETVAEILAQSTKVFERLESVVLTIFRHHRDLLCNETQIFELISTAREERWECIREFDDFIVTVFANLIEEGSKSGEFNRLDPTITSTALHDCLWIALHPHMRCDYEMTESEARVVQQIRFLGRILKASH